MTNGVLIRKSGKKLPRLPLVDCDAHRRQKTDALVRQTSEDERQQPFGLRIEPLGVVDGNQNRCRGGGRHDGVEHTCRERGGVQVTLSRLEREGLCERVGLWTGQRAESLRFGAKQITEATEDQSCIGRASAGS